MVEIQGGSVLKLIEDFNGVRTHAEYKRVKAQAEKQLDAIGILALVDTMIDAHNRITAGVR